MLSKIAFGSFLEEKKIVKKRYCGNEVWDWLVPY